MSRITAIEPQQRNPQRVNVYLDGEFAFGLSRVVAAWLKPGDELSDEKVTRLRLDDEGETAYQKALHFLSFRPRSSAEIRQNLTKRGVAEDIVEATLVRLKSAGLVDDEAFARAWVENRSEFRPRSKTALRIELRRKGLADEVIQTVLDQAADDQALAFQAARKYVRRLEGLEWLDFRQKLGGFLARRGFSYNTLSPVVSEVWKESQTADGGVTRDQED
jgi:regulatory protein